MGMTTATYSLDRILDRHPEALATLDRVVTGEAYFRIFQQLSDNYSPTMTVSRVQGPLVARLLAEGAGDPARLSFDPNTRRSGSMTVKVGDGRPVVWLSAHSDVCSYLTGPWDGSGYPLTPFCMHRTTFGTRAAMALAAPRGHGPLERLAEGVMITAEDSSVRFVCDRDDLPRHTRVVHHQAASWNQESGVVSGFLDNQAGSAALLLAAQALSHFDVNALMLLNDEEEGPVDKGNQGFSRAANRLLHRTPVDELPLYAIVSDGHGQEEMLRHNKPTTFGQGASFTGMSSQARGAVTPPQLLEFARELQAWAGPYGIPMVEHPGYVGRSDDISMMQFTPNVSIVGYPSAYSHFEHPPIAQMSDLVALTKVLALMAMAANDEAWQEAYL
jgi:hypothetical protein